MRASVPALSLAFSLSTPVLADPVDMSTITCAQMSSMKQDEVTFMLTWVAGYMAGEAEELSMDPEILGKLVGDIATYCGEHTEMSVINAAREVSTQ